MKLCSLFFFNLGIHNIYFSILFGFYFKFVHPLTPRTFPLQALLFRDLLSLNVLYVSYRLELRKVSRFFIPLLLLETTFFWIVARLRGLLSTLKYWSYPLQIIIYE